MAEWFDLYDGTIQEVKLTHNGRSLLVTGQEKNAMMWDISGENPVYILTLAGHNYITDNSAISPDDQQVITISDGSVRLWDVSSSGLGEVQNIADFSSYPVDFRPDINRLVTMDNEGAVNIWNTNTGKLEHAFDSLVQNRRGFLASAISPDGQQIARGSNDGTIRIWDLTTQQEKASWVGHGPGLVGGFFPGIISVDYSPSGSLLATAGADGYVMVWDLTTLEKVYEWRVDPRPSYWSEDNLANGVTQVKFSPDGETIAAATDAGPDDETALIKVWDLATGEGRVLAENIPGRIWGLAYSPNGQHLAGSNGDGIVIYDVATDKQIAFLPGDGPIFRFSVDGKQIITGNVWDIESEEVLFTLPDTGILILSADGQYVVTNGSNGIHFYTLDFDELIDIARSRVTRSLTDAECKEYLHVEVCPAN